MKHKLALLLALILMSAPDGRVSGATIGPLPYHNIADSPFDLSRRGVDFYVENFSTQLLHVPPTGADAGPFFTKFSTPGATETTGYAYPFASPSGGELDALPRDVANWDGTQAIDLSFEFDASELGRLPNAVGFRITNWSPITVNFYAE